MNAVATDATDIGLAMRRTLKVCVLALMTTQALRVQLLRGSIGRAENFGLVAARLDVCATGSVATLAGDAGLAVLERQLAVRVGRKSLGYLNVAGCAGIRSDKILWSSTLRLL